MSYDIHIGNKQEFNHTWNTNKMFYAHNEQGIRLHYGLTGEEAIEPLGNLYLFMIENRKELLRFEPENGWGSYESSLSLVHKMIEASLKHPEEIWKGD